MDAGRTILRLTIGPLFIGHGTQKLFGWFGGGGLEQTGESFEQLGMRPGRRHAMAAGAAETFGGAMIALGFMTPVAAGMLTGVMATAIHKVHAKNGVWAQSGGFEYNAVLIAALAVLVEQGPGRPSFDAVALPRFKGAGLALLSLGVGAGGSLLNERLLNEAPADLAQATATAGEGVESVGGGV
jgi:putative oxidoreductase